ncbi:type IV pilin protein [Amphibiibacter pelophylacis]|uniref:Type II secretion system protein n=1 Tax=Amphibiibacter pelophylacis TaxID=1799477 RepID=A0ACC6P3P9_9BURK
MQRLSRTRCNSGMSLIELLVVCACVGILTLGSLGGLQAWRLRSQRQDGWLALQAVQRAQNDCRWRLGRYCTDWTELGLAATSPRGHFRLSLQDAAPGSYAAQAQAQGPQQQDSQCLLLRLHEDLWRSRRWAEPGPGACDLA